MLRNIFKWIKVLSAREDRYDTRKKLLDMSGLVLVGDSSTKWTCYSRTKYPYFDMSNGVYGNEKMDFKIIATDFDGTLCENKWPEIGEANDEIIKYLIEEQFYGAKIILWTCRIEDKLINAVEWCRQRGLHFDAVNENIPEAIEFFGSDTRKVFAHEYIDDRNCANFKLPFVKGGSVRMTTYDLLILFMDGEVKTINDVSEHRYNSENEMYSFVKNGYRTFIPRENVKVFGRKFDWENRQYLGKEFTHVYK